MKNTSKTFKTFVLLISFFMFTSESFAQIPGFPDDVNDEPAAPINSLVIMGLIAGAIYGVKKLK
ncbi:hypothetical protein [Flavobacteriaceae bacterium 14752]|uniref:hypothetical protein n=1 Tax=Mesohalobacter salilacus TaxID=2491711 RepID=UPI000F63A35C|nr:hypothetical protein EIG84_11315 [Flavobacteriaceae bacterium 14752]